MPEAAEGELMAAQQTGSILISRTNRTIFSVATPLRLCGLLDGQPDDIIFCPGCRHALLQPRSIKFQTRFWGFPAL